MNLSGCKFEMLTSNRSWRSTAGRVGFINNKVLSGTGLAQATSGMTRQAINQNKELYINYRNQASREKSRGKSNRAQIVQNNLHVLQA